MKIPTSIYYPIPLHLQPVYKHLGYNAGDFPVAKKIGKRVLSFPVFPEITEKKYESIANAVILFYRGGKACERRTT